MATDVVKVTGDYKIKTARDGTITLDTGVERGSVVVTGNLTVQGSTTTVTSENLDISDNIITLNKNETGAGVTLNTSGIDIERGTEPNATILWDDSLTYTKPGGGSGDGIFTFKVGTELGAIRTNHISTTGDDIVFLGTNAPNAKLSVRGTTNYEQNLDDDDIPNKKYVDNAFQTINIPLIQSGNTSLEAEDLQEGDAVSRLIGKIDNVTKFVVGQQVIQLGDLEVDNTTLRPTNSNSDLLLEANGTGEVVVDEVLSLPTASSAPSGSAGRLKVYVDTQGFGGTGLFFVNNTVSGEVTSKRKAMLMSMIF